MFALEKVCDTVPKRMAGACKTLIDTYGPMLLDYVKNDMTADEMCKAVHVCPNRAVARKSECGLCSMVTSLVLHKVEVA